METSTTHRTRLAEIMDLEGRKQTWLARVVGTSRQRINDYCNGLHASDDMRDAIAEALGREVDDVFPERWPA